MLPGQGRCLLSDKPQSGQETSLNSVFLREIPYLRNIRNNSFISYFPEEAGCISQQQVITHGYFLTDEMGCSYQIYSHN